MNSIRQKDDMRIDLILELVRFFERHKIEYMLSGGTACWLLKEGGIYIPSEDHDIDFHVWIEQRDQILKKCQELKSAGFEMTDHDFKIQFSRSNLVNLIIEILFLYKEANSIYFKKNANNSGKYSGPIECFMTRKKVVENSEISLVNRAYCDRFHKN